MVYLTTHSIHFIYGYMAREREMFYLTTHLTHFIYSYMARKREMFYLTTHLTHFIYGYMAREMFYLTTHSTHFIYGYMARERNVLFNDALDTFYLRLYGEREMFYLTTHSTHFIYGYMASHIWLRTILIVRKETHCRHIGYSYRLTARVLLYAPSHRQDSTYHGLCYTSRGALAGTTNSSMGPPQWRIDPTTHRTMNERSTSELRPAPQKWLQY